jgi:hypothetical protein
VKSQGLLRELRRLRERHLAPPQEVAIHLKEESSDEILATYYVPASEASDEPRDLEHDGPGPEQEEAEC